MCESSIPQGTNLQGTQTALRFQAGMSCTKGPALWYLFYGEDLILSVPSLRWDELRRPYKRIQVLAAHWYQFLQTQQVVLLVHYLRPLCIWLLPSRGEEHTQHSPCIELLCKLEDNQIYLHKIMTKAHYQWPFAMSPHPVYDREGCADILPFDPTLGSWPCWWSPQDQHNTAYPGHPSYTESYWETWWMCWKDPLLLLTFCSVGCGKYDASQWMQHRMQLQVWWLMMIAPPTPCARAVVHFNTGLSSLMFWCFVLSFKRVSLRVSVGFPSDLQG